MWDPYGTHLANRIWANPYGTHREPGCTPHMSSPYGIHICMFAGEQTRNSRVNPITLKCDLDLE